MQKEIEIKLIYKSRPEIVLRLKKIKAKYIKKFTLQDKYYAMPGTSMDKTNNLIRIRKKGAASELTFKGECKDANNVWERTELTTRIEDYKAMQEIILKLGMVLIKENMSHREIWVYKDCEIAFIDFTKPYELHLLEIEGPSQKSVNDATQLLKDLTSEATESIFKKFDKA